MPHKTSLFRFQVEAGKSYLAEEGEVRWHHIQDVLTLDGLAAHQLLFLDRVLLHDDGFYSGVAVFRNGRMVRYLDGEKSVAGP